MLAIRKQDGEYRAAAICDECGIEISDALSALVLSSAAPEGATEQAFHVHKGRCEQALSARIEGLSGSEELSVHLAQLMKNALRNSTPDQVEALFEELT